MRLQWQTVSKLEHIYIEVLVGELGTQAHHLESSEKFLLLLCVFSLGFIPGSVLLEFGRPFGVFSLLKALALEFGFVDLFVFEVGFVDLVRRLVGFGVGLRSLLMDDFFLEGFLSERRVTLVRCAFCLSLSCLMRSSKETSAMVSVLL